jgi:hypothetical protein
VGDAAIHRVWGEAVGVVSSVAVSQWIATPAGARDDKSGVGA